jgi:hypothetical protein
MADEDTNTETDVDMLDTKSKDDLWSSRRKMAWVSLWGIIIPTIFVILRIHDPAMVEKIGNMMSWYYLSLASIIGAYFGFKAWSTVKGLGKTGE